MIQAFFLCLLLIYYWYFYASFSKPIVKPSTGSPSNPTTFKFEFNSKRPNHFQFIIDGRIDWEHTLPVDTFTFHKGKILPTDPCYGNQNGTLVAAEGKYLYEYLLANPESKNVLNFKDNSEFTAQKGIVFYFKCMKNHIEKLGTCPSGTILVANMCQPVNLCTDRQDGTLLSHSIASQYITCAGGIEHVKKCPKETIFNHDRCESIKDLHHYCKHFDKPFLLDDETRVECRNEKPFYITCKPGMKFFNNDYCEPSLCVGLPNDTKLPLSESETKPFKFVPGYMTCQNDKIHNTVECPQNWDESLSREDNLLSLPMVFDINSKTCSIPTFCENVFSNDPDIIVPAHEYTKHVKNWKWGKLYDHASGFTCENKTRKRKTLPNDMRISKRFKIEPACGPNMPKHLPIHMDYHHYYDCDSKTNVCCPDDTFFNGSECVHEPKYFFEYKGFPLFSFDALNFESWIQALDYSKDIPVTCQYPETTFLELYNICTHPDCENYAFVSQIPNMAILLPREQRAKCQFDKTQRILKKEPVDFDYHFWNQKIVEGENEEKPCKTGQHLETGNFIWDSTIFATCNMNQPFVFCPSTYSKNIIPASDGFYACEPPKSDFYIFDRVNEWTEFERNEIKRILPINWDNANPQYIRRNKRTGEEILPENGLEILEGERINLLVSHPVKIQPRFRITNPPNVAFEYDNQNNLQTHTSTSDRGFLTKLKNFTGRALTFPTYTPMPLVEDFNTNLHV